LEHWVDVAEALLMPWASPRFSSRANPFAHSD
jgi:hypothetical protein